LADGAGGNRNIGIDPQVFSRSLLGYCVEIIKSEDILPNQMAKLACKSIHILESKQIDGSGTLCLLALDKQTNRIHALNIGDSGFRLFRNGAIVEKSQATMAGSSPKQLYVSDSSSYKGISFINEE
jgi:protein phosphatase PTC7